MNRFKLIIEDFACWGCKACEVACKQEFNQDSFGAYDPQKRNGAEKYVSIVEDGPRIMDERLDFMYRAKVCKHCDDPACVPACPEGAISKDSETGIVLHDKEKCTGCGSAPGKSGMEKQMTSPCKIECPAHNNIQAYVNLAARGKFAEAVKVIKETSPFPSTCGRVCYHPCESDCNRKEVDEPLNIHSIERFLGDSDLESGTPYVPEIRESRNEKVAVVGAGPAGLTAAFFLARDGYQVTVFEKHPVTGGMLALGIPDFRLPKSVLGREIDIIKRLGVRIETGVEIGRDITIRQLREDNFRAFFLAIGAHTSKRLGIEGEDLEGVYAGVDFLRDISLGNKPPSGKRVAVVGGGNVAIDAARSALRTGFDEAFILYRRSMEEMPAGLEEIEDCKDEGIEIKTLTIPRRIIGENGEVRGVECLKMKLGEPDESGRKAPAPVDGSEFLLEVDALITAVGQEPESSFIGNDSTFSLSKDKTIAVDPLTLQTQDPDIFAGGDAVTGPATVIEAIAAGRKAAISIDRRLRGLSLTSDRAGTLSPIDKPLKEGFDPAPRAEAPELDPRARIEGFAEVRSGFDEKTAVRESGRCISCGAACIQACPYDAVTFNPETGKARKCNLCYNRVINGLYPACADNICLAHCIYFGDPAEIENEILRKRTLRGGRGEIIPKSISFTRR